MEQFSPVHERPCFPLEDRLLFPAAAARDGTITADTSFQATAMTMTASKTATQHRTTTIRKFIPEVDFGANKILLLLET